MEISCYLIGVFLFLGHSKYEQDVVLHHLFDQLAQSWILLEQKQPCVNRECAVRQRLFITTDANVTRVRVTKKLRSQSGFYSATC